MNALLFLTCAVLVPFGKLSSFAQTEPNSFRSVEQVSHAWVEASDVAYCGESYQGEFFLSLETEIRGFSGKIYYDEEMVDIVSTNCISSSVLHDLSIGYGVINYSFLFDHSTQPSSESPLFSFDYSIEDNASIGDYFFDVIINEAYDEELQTMDVTSERMHFSVVEKQQEPHIVRSVEILSETSQYSVYMNDEFVVRYLLDDPEIASGSLTIIYEPEVIELISVLSGGYLSSAIFDYRIDESGIVHAAFIKIETGISNVLLELKFKCLINASSNSNIELSADELFDNELYPVLLADDTIVSVTTHYSSSFDPTPCLRMEWSFDYSIRQLSIVIKLDKNSHLGAGDFALTFDPNLFTLIGYEKLFSPTFFVVNDKQTQLENGVIKFSIISLSDIVDETRIIKFNFSYIKTSEGVGGSALFIRISGATDSLTNPINLGAWGLSFFFPSAGPLENWMDDYLHMNDPAFDGEGTGACVSEGLYLDAKRAFFDLESGVRDPFTYNNMNRYTAGFERYLAWAKANGDSRPFQEVYQFNTSPSYFNQIIFSGDETASVILVLTCVVFTIASVSFFIRKKPSRDR